MKSTDMCTCTQAFLFYQKEMGDARGFRMFYCATFRGKGGGEATKGGRAFGPKVLKVLKLETVAQQPDP
ncbi:hypothetical protein, partial [uncultured Dialister sp.]|uniref:hypothetical protein n=1 Tax=uncultured Dialister sp. TaxID=278064 RepID=UPI0026005C2B